MMYKLAWRNLWRNRRRTLITTASIFFAIMLAICMRALQEGSYDKMIENVVSFYTGYVQVHQRDYWDEQTLENSFEATQAVEEELIAHPQVEQAIPRLESFALASSTDITKGCLVVGTDPSLEDRLTHLASKVVKGQYFAGSGDQALIAEGLAEQLELGVGDTLILIGQGYHGVTAAGKFAIQGILSFGSPDLNKQMVYLPLGTAQHMYGAQNRLTSLVLSLSNPQAAQDVVRDLQARLDSTYEAMEWQQMMPELVQSIEADRGGGIIMMAVLYMIIGFGIFGTVLMMTAERQYEFGVMVAIGMKKFKLVGVMVIETVLIALLGILAGSLASVPIVLYYQYNPIYLESMQETYEQFGMEPVLPMTFDLSIFANQALVVLILTVLIGLYPLVKIGNLNPIQAMRA